MLNITVQSERPRGLRHPAMPLSPFKELFILSSSSLFKRQLHFLNSQCMVRHKCSKKNKQQEIISVIYLSEE